MKCLGCDALQLQFIPISCTFDPNYNQHGGHDDANGSQSQKHHSFSQHTLVPDSAKAGGDSSCDMSLISEPLFPDQRPGNLWMRRSTPDARSELARTGFPG